MDFIMLGLAAVNTAFTTSTHIVDALAAPDKNIDELLRRTREVQAGLIEAQKALHALADENFRMKRAALEDDRLQKIRDDMEYAEGGFFIKKSERDAGKFIPYCGTCWGGNEVRTPTPGATNGTLHCGKCGTGYLTQEYRDRYRKVPSKITPRPSGSDSWMAS